jgi:regulator of cell morphogenesis and NO signaling
MLADANATSPAAMPGTPGVVSSVDGLPTSALVEHILERYHATHRQQLAELVPLAEKVEAVHGADPAAPSGLAEMLGGLRDELAIHMAKEEAVLFPAMRAGLPHLDRPIATMRADHDDHAEALGAMLNLCYGCVPPQHACGSWRRLYASVETLVADLREHVRLENEVLFPRFESAR